MRSAIITTVLRRSYYTKDESSVEDALEVRLSVSIRRWRLESYPLAAAMFAHRGRRSCKTLCAERRSCVVLGPSLGSRHMKPTWPAVRHACREVADGLTKQRTAHLPAYVIYHTVSSLNRCNGRKTRLSVDSRGGHQQRRLAACETRSWRVRAIRSCSLSRMLYVAPVLLR